jgi:hypothetical protein
LEKTIKRQVFPQAPSPVVAQYVRPHEPGRHRVWVVSFRRVWFHVRRINDRIVTGSRTRNGDDFGWSNATVSTSMPITAVMYRGRIVEKAG